MDRLKAALLSAFISAAAGGLMFDVTDRDVFQSVEGIQSMDPALSRRDATEMNRKLAAVAGLNVFSWGWLAGAISYRLRAP